MTILRLPKPPRPGPRGPRPIYVCAPSYVAMVDSKKKFGLGFTGEGAKVAFYGGDPRSQTIDSRTFTLATAPGWLKFQIVSQLELLAGIGQPLSDVEEEARARLGNNPYAYGRGPRLPKRRSLDKLFG
jgi:hypothetical protein